MLLIRHTLNPFDKAKSDVVTIMIDNEFVFFAPASLLDEDLWSRIDEVRDLKNTTFQSSITETLLNTLR